MSEAVGVITNIIEAAKTETFISPTWVATRAMYILDPAQISPAAVRWLATEHVKQLSRELLRKLFEPTDLDNPQHEIFAGLQARYPVAKPASRNFPEYVRRDEMSYADVAFNVDRFRKVSEAYSKHADALQVWWDGRQP